MNDQRFYINTDSQSENVHYDDFELAKDPIGIENPPDEIFILYRSGRKLDEFWKKLPATLPYRLLQDGRFFHSGTIPKTKLLKDFIRAIEYEGMVDEPVIACGLNSSDLFKIEECLDPVRVIAVPNLMDDIEEWIRVWNPIEISNVGPVFEPIPDPPRVVQIALREMDRLEVGKHNYPNTSGVRFYLRCLLKYGPALDGDQLKSFVIRDLSWSFANAQKLKEYIVKLNVVESLKRIEDPEMLAYYQRWAEKCADDETEFSDIDTGKLDLNILGLNI